MKVYIICQTFTYLVGENPKILFVTEHEEKVERYLKELNDRKDTLSRYYLEEHVVSE